MSADEASAHRWSEFSHPVFNFACVLRAADLMPDDENEYWEKPQKWDREHRLWTEAGERGAESSQLVPTGITCTRPPQPDDGAGESTPGHVLKLDIWMRRIAVDIA